MFLADTFYERFRADAFLLSTKHNWRTMGIIRTGLMGAVLVWGFLASGSLWPPILAHTFIDLLVGLVFGDRLLIDPAD